MSSALHSFHGSVRGNFSRTDTPRFFFYVRNIIVYDLLILFVGFKLGDKKHFEVVEVVPHLRDS